MIPHYPDRIIAFSLDFHMIELNLSISVTGVISAILSTVKPYLSVVLEEGKVACFGSPKELLSTRTPFCDLV